MDIEQFKANLYAAFRKLREEEESLFGAHSRNQHEVTLSTQLACKLKPLFCDFDVDCEYFRQGAGEEKKDATGEKRRVDVVIHERGPSGRNLANIEIKWNSNSDNDKYNIMNLSNHSYTYGVEIRFHPNGCVAVLNIYDYANRTWTDNLASEANAYPGLTRGSTWMRGSSPRMT